MEGANEKGNTFTALLLLFQNNGILLKSVIQGAPANSNSVRTTNPHVRIFSIKGLYYKRDVWGNFLKQLLYFKLTVG